MHPLYLLRTVTGRVTNPRYLALNAGIEEQRRSHGTVFLYPEDRVVKADRSGGAHSIHR